MKISEPLKHCVTLCLALDELVKQYKIEYERLPYFCLCCSRLDHVGSNCELKQKRDITTEQYGRWKTMLKDVFSIGLVNGLTRNQVGLGVDETQLDNCASPPKVVGVVCLHEVMGNGRGEITMEEDGLGSDHVLRLFKKGRFSTEGEGHTTTAPMGEGPREIHKCLSMSVGGSGTHEVLT